MRRALASLLLVLFSFPLIGPLFDADAASNLPACCRRAGIHHCATPSDNPNSGMNAVRPKCANYPASPIFLRSLNVAMIAHRGIIVAIPIRGSAFEVRDDVRSSNCFIRTHQQRGPPISLS